MIKEIFAGLRVWSLKCFRARPWWRCKGVRREPQAPRDHYDIISAGSFPSRIKRRYIAGLCSCIQFGVKWSDSPVLDREGDIRLVAWFITRAQWPHSQRIKVHEGLSRADWGILLDG